jgi:hypothetical protein
MCRCVALVITDVSKEHISFNNGVERISELGTTLTMLLTANFFPSSLFLYTLIIEVILSSETSVLTTATQRHISQDSILKEKNSARTILVLLNNFMSAKFL